MQDHNGILSAGKQQHRILALRSHFPDDKNGFGFEFLEVGQVVAHDRAGYVMVMCGSKNRKTVSTATSTVISAVRISRAGCSGAS